MFTWEPLENEWNRDKPVASICGSSLAAWFLKKPAPRPSYLWERLPGRLGQGTIYISIIESTTLFFVHILLTVTMIREKHPPGDGRPCHHWQPQQLVATQAIGLGVATGVAAVAATRLPTRHGAMTRARPCGWWETLGKQKSEMGYLNRIVKNPLMYRSRSNHLDAMGVSLRYTNVQRTQVINSRKAP